MRYLDCTEITLTVEKMCIKANRLLPPDVEEALKNAEKCEGSSSGKEVLRQLVQNCAIAREYSLPLCQDTGIAVFFIELGQDLVITGKTLEESINEGVREGYRNGLLRKSMCDPFTRQNTTDNTPALIHVNTVPGDKLRIKFIAKGGGSENMSRLVMLPPASGWAGIKEFVLNTVAIAGANPCPPIVLGIGIGGSFDYAPILAKKALFEPLNTPNPIHDLAEKEAELLTAINNLGIGPMGYAMNESSENPTPPASTTCLGVHIKASPCHIASLPVAVNVQCHSSRHMELVL